MDKIFNTFGLLHEICSDTVLGGMTHKNNSNETYFKDTLRIRYFISYIKFFKKMGSRCVSVG